MNDRVNNLSGRVFNEEPPHPGKILQGSQLVLSVGHIFYVWAELSLFNIPLECTLDQSACLLINF